VSEKEPSGSATRRGHDYISLFVDMARRKVVYVADGKDAATAEEFADFLEAHGGKREAVTDASIDMGAAFEAGIKENFPNAEITFDKFHVVKLANNRRSGRPCLSDGKAIALEHSGGSFIARHLVQAGKPASRAFALSRLRSLLASASVLDVAGWTAQPVEAVGVGSTPWRAREDRAPNRSPKARTMRLRDCRLSAALRQSQRTEEATLLGRRCSPCWPVKKRYAHIAAPGSCNCERSAVAAYRAALEEWTRELVALDWAMTQINVGNAPAWSSD
jgi:Transposase